MVWLALMSGELLTLVTWVIRMLLLVCYHSQKALRGPALALDIDHPSCICAGQQHVDNQHCCAFFVPRQASEIQLAQEVQNHQHQLWQ